MKDTLSAGFVDNINYRSASKRKNYKQKFVRRNNNDDTRNSKKLFCNYCKRTNHNIKDCFLLKKKNNRKFSKKNDAINEIISSSPIDNEINSLNDSFSQLIIKGTISDYPCSFLIDTGASMSYIDFETYKKISFKKQPQTFSGIVTAANNSPLKIYGQLEIDFFLLDQHFSHNFIIADLQQKIILGNDFLFRHNANINFEDNKITINNFSETFSVRKKEYFFY